MASPFPGAIPPWNCSGGLLALGLWLRFPDSPLLLVYGPLVFLLLVLAFLDLEHWWLPDVITYPGIGLGLILAPVFSQLSLLEVTAGALGGWLFLETIRWGYKRLTGRDGMGGGDAEITGPHRGLPGN